VRDEGMVITGKKEKEGGRMEDTYNISCSITYRWRME
jgi:hypothetical protein